MDNNKNEKVKKIRKILLLKINEELKDILKNKSNIKINSMTIPELNKLYTLNDIQLFEKPALYSHYVKTEEAVVPKLRSQEKNQMKISKSVNKIRSKKKSRVILHTPKDKKSSFEEDLDSQLNSFFPKKIELGRRKLKPNKSKNKGSIPNILHKGIHFEKENGDRRPMMSQSTRMNKRDLHLNRLIGRITIIKDYKINEDMIKASIKKLRNYCYQLRKKKKRPKKFNNYSYSKKSIDKNKIKKRNAIKETGLLKKSDTLTKQSFFRNYMNISKKNMVKLENLHISNKNKKLSKISLKSLSPSRQENKVNKAFFPLVRRAKYKKGKKSNKNSIKSTINMIGFESNEAPNIYEIHKNGIPFFHKTTVNINEDEIPEREKKEKKKSDKKVILKDNTRQRKKIKMLDNSPGLEVKQELNNSGNQFPNSIIQRRKSKMLENPPQLEQKQESNNTGNKFLGLIHQRKKSKMFDNPPVLEQKPEVNNTDNKFLNLNYVYNRNNNKKSTKVEMNRVPSNKKLMKIELKKDYNDDNSLAIIKLSKVNNGEIQKKLKKKQIKEKKLIRKSYVSNKTDTNGYSSKENVFQKSAIKK